MLSKEPSKNVFNNSLLVIPSPRVLCVITFIIIIGALFNLQSVSLFVTLSVHDIPMDYWEGVVSDLLKPSTVYFCFCKTVDFIYQFSFIISVFLN